MTCIYIHLYSLSSHSLSSVMNELRGGVKHGRGGEVGLGWNGRGRLCMFMGAMQSRPCEAEGSGVSWGSGDDGMIGQ
jgi:hypothetical protein